MPNVAAQWPAWDRRAGGAPGPFIGAGDQFDDPFVELYLGAAWIDISPYIYYRDRISISRGRSDESAQVERSTARLTINNRDGMFSPRNPTSPYYGLLGRNTPIRISKRQGDITRYRFTGEVSTWPQRWDITGTDVYVPIEASGIIRRLDQGDSPLRSALFRQITTQVRPVAYWPIEDGPDTQIISNVITTGAPMYVQGSVGFDADGPDGAAGAASFEGGGSLVGAVSMSSTPNGWLISWWLNLPADYDATAEWGCPISWSTPSATATSGEAFRRWGACIERDPTLPLSSQLAIYREGATTATVHYDPTSLRGIGPTQVVVWGENIGADTFISAWVNGVEGINVLDTGKNTGPITGVTAGAGAVEVVTAFDRSGTVKGTISSIVVAQRTTANFDSQLSAEPSSLRAGRGYSGETAGRRLERLCREEDVPFFPRGNLDDTVRMGAQRPDALLNLIRECATADQGMLLEPRDAVGLGYRPRTTLYNQAAALSLSYSAHQLADALSPVDDDQNTRNDVTAKRPDGGTVRVQQTTGNLSVADPPAGVGRYDEQVTTNVELDRDLGDQAGWRVLLGTVDEARYPQLPLNLKHSTFTGSDAMTGAALALDVGDRVTVADLPAWLPPDLISQLLQGYTETFDQVEHEMTLNCSPESPYRVAVLDDVVLGRADTSGSQLAADATAAATSLSVATTTGPVWTTAGAEFPFDIRVGGEVMTVTAVSGSSSPQAFTVTRSINGVVKAQPAGAAVSLNQPMIVAL